MRIIAIVLYLLIEVRDSEEMFKSLFDVQSDFYVFALIRINPSEILINSQQSHVTILSLFCDQFQRKSLAYHRDYWR